MAQFAATLDQPISKEEAGTTRTIYPDGTGAFACDSPDGLTLRDRQALEVFLGGYWISGIIEHRVHEVPKFVARGGQTTCGLCAGMQIRLPT